MTKIINLPIVSQIVGPSYFAYLLASVRRRMAVLGIKRDQYRLHWGVFFGVALALQHYHPGIHWIGVALRASIMEPTSKMVTAQ